MRKLIVSLVIGLATVYLAALIIPGVEIIGGFKESWKIFIFAGAVLGAANYFIKPAVNLVALPLRLLTFGVFGIIVNMSTVWLTDILFPELVILGLWPLFWTGLLIWFLNIAAFRAGKKYFE